MKKDYCVNCDKEVKFRTTVRKEIYHVRGVEIEIDSTIAVCPYCKDDLFHEPYEEINLENAYKKYEQQFGENPRA